ncbi:MAG: zinc ribbon domain-containing protein [Clostridiales bacterium]|nr:zinc ribbon domain-containing protein [Clostridiales bacterium]
MAYCKHCGTEIPDFAKFCPKCGTADPIQVQEVKEPPKAPEQPVAVKEEQPQPVQPTPQPTQPAQQQSTKDSNPDVKGWFTRNFMILYVLTGILAYALTELSASYMSVSKGFSITLGVFAILIALVFALIGIFNFITSLSASPELREKNRTKNIIIFIIGLVVFVYVLLMCIVVFDTLNTLNLFGFFG